MGDNGLINLPPASGDSLASPSNDSAMSDQRSMDDSKLSPADRLKKNQGDYAKRISELTSRNDRLLAAIEESNNRYSALADEFKSFKESQSRSSQESSRPRSEYERHATEDLERAEIEFLNPQSERFSPEKAYEIRKEVRRREREEMQREFESRISKERQSRELKDMGDYAVVQAAQLLGESGSNYVDFNTRTIKDTQESRIAGSIYQNLKKDLDKRGVSVDSIPELKAYSILLADRFVSAQRDARQKSEARQAETALNRDRVSGQLSAQSEAAAETENRIRTALEKGSIDSVLGELDVIKKYEARRKPIKA